MKTQDFVSDGAFVSVYRIGLVRDEHVKFDRVPLCVDCRDLIPRLCQVILPIEDRGRAW
jgi:hypothetical protein